MFEELIQELTTRAEFIPFRIRLVSGDFYNVSAPREVAQIDDGLYIAMFDGHWVQFPYDRIASVESLMDGEF